MFRKMRRERQQLPQAEAEAILREATSGVLAVLGDDGYPYAVPLSHFYDGRTLWFHCAREGHKLDAVRAGDKASFCVVAMDQVVPEKYTTCYRSAIAFGRVRVVEDPEEARSALAQLADRYWPQAGAERRDRVIGREQARLAMLALEIEHLTGKEGLELARARAGKAEN